MKTKRISLTEWDILTLHHALRVDAEDMSIYSTIDEDNPAEVQKLEDDIERLFKKLEAALK